MASTGSTGIGVGSLACQASGQARSSARDSRRHLATMLWALELAGLIALAPITARAEIVIGAVGPVTGPLASLGEQMLAGARQAVEDINAQGRVLGKELKLRIGDDQCGRKQAVTVAGHIYSDATTAASKVYQEEGVIMITSTAGSVSMPMVRSIYRAMRSITGNKAPRAMGASKRFPRLTEVRISPMTFRR